MRKRIKQMRMLFLVLATVGWATESIAQQLTLTIDFGGQCAPKSTTGNPTNAPVVLNITTGGAAFTCGNYTIRPQSSAQGEARLESGSSDASNDVLVLRNTRITKAAGSWPDFHITISGVNRYDVQPSAIPGGPDQAYRISASGFFKRGITTQLAAGSYIKTRGYQENPTQATPPPFWLGSQPPSESNGIELAHVVCSTSGCSNYIPSDYAASTVWIQAEGHTLASSRDLMAEFWVKLNNNADALNLTQMTVENTLPGHGGGGRDPEEIPPGCPVERCVPCDKKSPKCEHEPDVVQPWYCRWFGVGCE